MNTEQIQKLKDAAPDLYERAFRGELNGSAQRILSRRLSPGARAGTSGAIGEAVVEAILDKLDIPFEDQVRLEESIYGHPFKVDFEIPRGVLARSPVIIEVKWQSTTGSADEKLPYLVQNIKFHYPWPAVIVYGGTGWRPGAIAWLRMQRDGHRLLAVLNVDEFVDWASRLAFDPAHIGGGR